MKRIIIATFGLGLFLAGTAAGNRPAAGVGLVPAEWSGKVTDTTQLPIERNDWGTLQWVCNGKLIPGAEQTVGLATILPGKQNPVHYHPNCEEVLYVMSGEGIQSYDNRTIALQAGMTVRIPPKIKHNLKNTGSEPLRTLVSFSSGDRQTVWVGQQPEK
jgi:mannose-6-phosphate isomerase-like protein (cupin superfamily)